MPCPPAPGLAAPQKTLPAQARDEEVRATWRVETAALDPADLLFLDETSPHPALTRRRARAPRGERARGVVPRNHGPNVTLVAVVGPRGITTALAIPGATTRAVFDGFVAQVLVPLLRPGQTVVLDNLSVHQSVRAQELVEAAGGRLRCLPPDSPDFTPIAPVFAKVKTWLRATGARSQEDLLAATKMALDAVTAEDAAGCYAACGFPLPMQLL